jgi:hypothetical protein
MAEDKKPQRGVRNNADGSRDIFNSKGERVAHYTPEQVKMQDAPQGDVGFYSDGKGGLTQRFKTDAEKRQEAADREQWKKDNEQNRRSAEANKKKRVSQMSLIDLAKQATKK